MKKNFLYVLTAVVLLSGCSNNLDEITKKDNNPGLDADGNEPVEIVLGAKAPELTVTRAAITADTWTGKIVGILALAKEKTSDTTIPGFDTPEGLLLNTTGIIGGNAALSFSNNVKFYYPLGNDNNYSFYGYYPTVQGATPIAPVVAPTGVTCAYTLNGTQDILIARAAVDQKLEVTPDFFDGYNARYFRKGGITPNLAFKHLLTKLTFNIIAGKSAGGEGTTDAAKKLKVNSIKIKGIKNMATLSFPIALNQEAAALTFGAGTSDFTLRGSDDAPAVAVNPADLSGEIGVIMGDGILLPAGSKTYAMDIEVQDEADNKITSSLVITIPNAAASIAGTSYRVNMTIYGLEEVKLTTTLVDWKTGADINLEL